MAAFTKAVGTQRSKCRALRRPVTKQIQELKTWMARGSSTARHGASVSPRLELRFTSGLPEFSKQLKRKRLRLERCRRCRAGGRAQRAGLVLPA